MPLGYPRRAIRAIGIAGDRLIEQVHQFDTQLLGEFIGIGATRNIQRRSNRHADAAPTAEVARLITEHAVSAEDDHRY